MAHGHEYRQSQFLARASWFGLGRDHLVVAAILYGLEKTRVEHVFLGDSELALRWTIVAVIAAVLVTRFIVHRNTGSESAEDSAKLDPAHLLLEDLVIEAAKQCPLPACIEVAVARACHGLERVRSDWVRASWSEDPPHPPGISPSGSSWTYRVGPHHSALTFTTGGRFTEMNVVALRRVTKTIDFLLWQAAALNVSFPPAQPKPRRNPA